jgi:MFS family permease
MQRAFKCTNVVLILLCAMYFVTYIMRQNITVAGSAIQQEFRFSNTQLGLIFSAYAYPYLLFQIVGGWLGDRFGPRLTLFVSGLVWAGATMMTSLATGLVSLFLIRVLMGFGVGATLPTATRAMQHWVESKNHGFAQGITHSFARIGTALTPPVVAALVIAYSWRASFVIMGAVGLIWVGLWFWYFRDDPKEHPLITQAELAALPQRPKGPSPIVPWARLVARMWPVTLTYFCYGWCFWLYLTWLPLFFKNQYALDISKSATFAAGVFVAGVIGDTMGGIISDSVLRRTGNLRLARVGVTVLGLIGALCSLLPIVFVQNITVVALCLSGGLFFIEIVIGPMWAIPMDIAPKYSGTASGLMNSGSAFAAIVSPLVAGFVIDSTGNWFLPFLMSMALLLTGTFSAFLMHPEKPFTEEAPPLAAALAEASGIAVNRAPAGSRAS